jgi:glycosyltransferase involved in cell wall biosynthesis
MTPALQTLKTKPEQDLTAADHSSSPWVLVAGGFHRSGGMDKANLALAQYLVEQNTPVHLVCHSVDSDFARHPLVTVHHVSRPAGSFFLGKPLLDIRGRRVARTVTRRWPRAQVLVNGDNCLWPGINWVHYVHNAWKLPQQGGPFWFQAKQNFGASLARKRERRLAGIARVFITNSNRTSRDLVEHLNAAPERVHTVYLGAESEWGLVTREEKAASRRSFQIHERRPLAVFIGSLGFDNRKGFDVLLKAWVKLCADSHWDVDMAVAGSGNAVSMWREEITRCGLGHRVRMLGFTERVRDLLAAADVLVSPVRYEPYGLNVQEAICRGVPAIVSAGAGVAERYGPEFTPMLLPDPEDVADLVQRLSEWRSNMEGWQANFQKFGDALRTYGWRDMARQIVSIASQQQAAFAVQRPEA